MRQLSTDLRRRRANNGTDQSNKRFRHPHLPPLFYVINSQDWESALRRTRRHPQEILCVDDASGDTPLHIACRLNPPENVIRVLLPAWNEKNNEGATALHVAASHRCSAAVVKVLVENGSAHRRSDVRMTTSLSLTKIGRLPLHYACLSYRGLSVEAFKILLEATIEACVSLEETGGASEDGNLKDLGWDDVTDVAHQQADGFTMQDFSGQTPLSLLFRRYKQRVQFVIKMLERHRNASSVLGSTMISAAAAVQDELGELWEKARLMVCLMAEKRLEREGTLSCIEYSEDSCSEAAAVALEAAKWAKQQYQQNQQNGDNGDYDQDGADNITNNRKFRLVHASVSLTGYGCPPEMTRLAISVYPNQVREMDEDGNLPLHIACAASSFLPSSNIGNEVSTGIISDEDSLLSSMSNASGIMDQPHPFGKVIRMLLRAYPAAARIPHGTNGRLPLILAIDGRERSMGDGIRALLEAYPAGLESKEIDHKLYPFILSSVGKPHKNDHMRNRINSIPRLRKKNLKPRRNVPTALFEVLRAKPHLVSAAANIHDP